MITNILLIAGMALSAFGALTTILMIGKERKPITAQRAAVTVSIHLVVLVAVTWALVK